MPVSPLQKVAAMRGGPCRRRRCPPRNRRWPWSNFWLHPLLQCTGLPLCAEGLAGAALGAIAAGLGAKSTPPVIVIADLVFLPLCDRLPLCAGGLAGAALGAIVAGLGATSGSTCCNRHWPCVAATRRVTAMRRGPCRSCCPRRNRRWPWSLVGSTRRDFRWHFCLPLCGGLPLCAEGLVGAALGAIVAGLGATSGSTRRNRRRRAAGAFVSLALSHLSTVMVTAGLLGRRRGAMCARGETGIYLFYSTSHLPIYCYQLCELKTNNKLRDRWPYISWWPPTHLPSLLSGFSQLLGLALRDDLTRICKLTKFDSQVQISN